jgi:predicted acylesterase/phospholipase RssA
MSVPYYYQPVIDSDTNHILIDGGVVSNYPLFTLTPDELSETLGIYFTTFVNPKEEIEMEDFAIRPLQIIISMRAKYELDRYKSNSIIVPIGSRSIVNFEITADEKKELMEIGKNATEEYFERRKRNIVRRYSVS